MDYSVADNALKDKVILITGAGAGIGKQAAISFAEHGATVILLGRTVKKLEQTYDEIESAGYPQPAIIPLDMKGATKQNYLDMVDTIESQFGRLDGVLHNASILGVISPFDQIGEDSFDDVMQVNVKAQFLLSQAYYLYCANQTTHAWSLPHQPLVISVELSGAHTPCLNLRPKA
ncbi:hypothetical protein JCM19238_5352 [Vibrio ponticus]|nr:hypothetical protein JCM19238_5352 [Vibrio ponticus]